MKWSVRLMRVAGIDLRLHTTFLLLAPYIIWQTEPLTVGSVAMALLLLITLFVCVALHEFGHAFAARTCGIGTEEVMLWPLGGWAKLERNPERPAHELWIALAGPLVNGVIAAVALVCTLVYAALSGLQAVPSFAIGTLSLENLLFGLFVINVLMALLNLIPAFPLDGGRMVRAGLLLIGVSLPNVAWAMKCSNWLFGGVLLLGAVALRDVFLGLLALLLFLTAGSAGSTAPQPATQEETAHPSAATPAPNATPQPEEQPVALPAPRARITQPLPPLPSEVVAQVSPAPPRRKRVMFVGAGNVALALLLLVSSLIPGGTLLYGAFFSGDSADVVLFGVVILSLAMLGLLIGAVLFAAAGVGLFLRHRWAYYLHIVACGLLSLTPIGALYGIPALVVALTPEFREYMFGPATRSAGVPISQPG